MKIYSRFSLHPLPVFQQLIPHAIVNMIGMLYKGENEIRENAYSPEGIVTVRQEVSAPVVKRSGNILQRMFITLRRKVSQEQ